MGMEITFPYRQLEKYSHSHTIHNRLSTNNLGIQIKQTDSCTNQLHAGSAPIRSVRAGVTPNRTAEAGMLLLAQPQANDIKHVLLTVESYAAQPLGERLGSVVI